MRNELILAGAIPAAALALIADFILKRIEIFVSPNNKRRKNPILNKQLETVRNEATNNK